MISELHLGNFDELARQLPYVDMIFTDPPYKRAEGAVECYRMLARWAPEILVDGGSLVMITPHYLLEEIMMIMYGRMKYRWAYCMDQEKGSHPRMLMGIEVCWKPMLHYVKRAYPNGRGFLRDKVSIPELDKSMHAYQQHEVSAEYYIEKLTKPGDTVLDPFMGTGTTLSAATNLGRGYIGIEIDPETFDIAAERLWQLSSVSAK